MFGSRRDEPAAAARGRRARRRGWRGEKRAARALRRAGYRVLARRVRTPYAEIDLVAREGDVLVIVEVKTSAGTTLPRPSRAQRRRLRRAGTWIQGRTNGPCRSLRYDLVAICDAPGHRSVQILRAHF